VATTLEFAAPPLVAEWGCQIDASHFGLPRFNIASLIPQIQGLSRWLTALGDGAALSESAQRLYEWRDGAGAGERGCGRLQAPRGALSNCDGVGGALRRSSGPSSARGLLDKETAGGGAGERPVAFPRP